MSDVTNYAIDLTVALPFLGHHVHYRPGWDCHGLPIELKVHQAASKGKDKTKKRLT